MMLIEAGKTMTTGYFFFLPILWRTGGSERRYTAIADEITIGKHPWMGIPYLIWLFRLFRMPTDWPIIDMLPVECALS